MGAKKTAVVLTQTQEDYLEIIYRLSQAGFSARVSEIARLMSCTMPTANRALHDLVNLGLVEQELYGPARLTTKGAMSARKVLRRHILLMRFLEVLGVSSEVASTDACRMEHILSQESIDAIVKYVNQHAPFENEKDRLTLPPPPKKQRVSKAKAATRTMLCFLALSWMPTFALAQDQKSEMSETAMAELSPKMLEQLKEAQAVAADADAETELNATTAESTATVGDVEDPTNELSSFLSAFLSPAEDAPGQRFYRLRYISAETGRRLLESFISPSGIVAKSDEDDRIFVSDSEMRLTQIDKIMAAADQPVPQVLVEARLLEFELTDDFAKEVQVGLQRTGSAASVGDILNVLGAPNSTATDYNGGGGGSSGKIWGAFGDDRTKLWSLIQYLQTRNRSRLLSAPNLLIRRGASGSINVGERVPISTSTITSGNITYSTTYETVGVKLTVSPLMIAWDENTNATPNQITEGRIRLSVAPEVSNISREAVGSGAPYFSTRSANTELEARSGETIVIGGLLRDESRVTKSEVPYLSKIPLLGWFFRGETTKSTQTQLVIFITPYIVTPANAVSRLSLQQGVTSTTFSNAMDQVEQSFKARTQPKAEKAQ